MEDAHQDVPRTLPHHALQCHVPEVRTARLNQVIPLVDPVTEPAQDIASAIIRELAMKAVPVYDAKNRFSELLALVEAGEEVAITRRGVLVARLVSAAPPDATAHKAAVADIFEQLGGLRRRVELDGDLKTLAREGLD